MLVLSKSKLNSYIQCPEKYKITYELGIKPLRATASFVEGRALHYLGESGLTAPRNLLKTLKQASKIFWKRNRFDICDYASKKDYKAAQVKCLNEAKRFLELIGPLNVKGTESYLEAPVIDPLTMDDTLDVTLRGYIDFVDMYEGKPRVVDIKTMSKKPMEGMASLALELTVYAYLLSYPYISSDMETISVAFLNLIRTKDAHITWDKSTRSIDDFVSLIHTIKAIVMNISNGVFYRNSGTHCSWCQNKPFCFKDISKAKSIFGKEALDRYLYGDCVSEDNRHEEPIYC